MIVEAVGESTLPVAHFAHLLLEIGIFVTALYTFRMFFLVFHGKERMDEHTREHVHESPAVVTVPLILLAIPSFAIGALTIFPLLFGGYFGDAIVVSGEHDVLGHLGEEFTDPIALMMHGFLNPAFWIAMAGLVTAWYLYIKRPELPAEIARRLSPLYLMLDRKYGFDELNEWFFARGARRIGRLFWRAGDVSVIDGAMVNGAANGVGWLAARVRNVQTGYLYHYAFVMIIGLLMLLTVFVIPFLNR
jgi:NADH-quinone oxidoreductase subunit L